MRIAPENRPPEAVNDAYHRVERIDEEKTVPEFIMNHRTAEPDWRNIKAELHYKWDDISEIPKFDIQCSDEKPGAQNCKETKPNKER